MTFKKCYSTLKICFHLVKEIRDVSIIFSVSYVNLYNFVCIYKINIMLCTKKVKLNTCYIFFYVIYLKYFLE